MNARILAALLVTTTLCDAQTPTTLLPEQQAQHVLNRLAFGPRPGDISKVRAMGVDKWIDQQLHPEKINDSQTASLLTRYRTLDTPTFEIEKAQRDAQQRRRQEQRMQAMEDSAAGRPAGAPRPNPAAARELPQRAIQDLLSAKVARAASSERQLY
ncbi:MAG TPA: DUF1800 family protein, partial [Gemmatimonadaceae bacterium]